MSRRRKHALLAIGLALPLLAGCGGPNQRQVQNDEYGDYRLGRVRNRPLGSNAGLVVFGVDKDREAREAAAAGGGGGGGGVSVNAYLWRAALDTLAFMPIQAADPFGGTIITDWYSPASAERERFRAQALLSGRQLRSDGVRVQVFRQVQGTNGTWTDAAVAPGTASEMEDRVLARARELRSQSAAR
jgi:uncharacterized lipoprotein